MTFEEFVIFRDVKVKNSNHERIVKLFYIYLQSVTGNKRLLPDIIGRLLNIDTTLITVPTGCFNGIFDNLEPPYDDVDLYIRLSNEVQVYVYGVFPSMPLKEIKENEYVIFVLSDDINGNIQRKENRHVYIT